MQRTTIGNCMVHTLNELQYERADFGLEFEKARINCGWNQDDCAAVFGVTRSTISGWENGKTFPEGELLLKALDFVKMASDYSDARANDCIFMRIKRAVRASDALIF